jgi:acid phosphatase
MKLRAFLALLCVSILSGCGPGNSQPRTHEDLDAAVWMRTSAEYSVLTTETFTQARDAVDVALRDPAWSALPAQAEKLLASVADPSGALPPAVIVDVDETVLDNSAYQVTQIQNSAEHNLEAWDRWVSQSAAPAVPGAAEFVQHCKDAGVNVFFVTNRDAGQEQFTRKNLEDLRLISPDVVDNILSKNERTSWTVDKSTRRDYVAGRYRVLVMVGDDLNDFVWTGDKPTPEKRKEAAQQNPGMWGKKWFMLPNANYGGWERAVYNFDDTLPRDDKIKLKMESLEISDPKSDGKSGKTARAAIQ